MLSHKGATVSRNVVEALTSARGSPYENRQMAVEPSISGVRGARSACGDADEALKVSSESSSVSENRRPRESWGRPASAIRSSSGRPKGWPPKMAARAPSLKASTGGAGSITARNS